MVEHTARNRLPLLVAGQGQKDVTHNEALLMIDALIGAAVERRDLVQPPTGPVEGQCWIVAAPAAGEWAGREGEIAIWSAGGWRFARAPDGATAWTNSEGVGVRMESGAWRTMAPRGAPAAIVALPIGGAVVDVEARSALGQLVSRLQALGLLAA